MTRWGYTIATTVIASAFAAAFVTVGVLDPRPRLIWNASASVPIGLYALQPPDALDVGELVAAMPPPWLARWLAARRYLPEGVPLLKHVAAKGGQRICRTGAMVSVDGRPVAIARARDSRGRALPVWHGCRTLAADELLLIIPAVPDSLDGRYFGALPAAAVIGRATLLYARALRTFHPQRQGRLTHDYQHP